MGQPFSFCIKPSTSGAGMTRPIGAEISARAGIVRLKPLSAVGDRTARAARTRAGARVIARGWRIISRRRIVVRVVVGPRSKCPTDNRSGGKGSEGPAPPTPPSYRLNVPGYCTLDRKRIRHGSCRCTRCKRRDACSDQDYGGGFAHRIRHSGPPSVDKRASPSGG
jgi:hypothetical protein